VEGQSIATSGVAARTRDRRVEVVVVVQRRVCMSTPQVSRIRGPRRRPGRRWCSGKGTGSRASRFTPSTGDSWGCSMKGGPGGDCAGQPRRSAAALDDQREPQQGTVRRGGHPMALKSTPMRSGECLVAIQTGSAMTGSGSRLQQKRQYAAMPQAAARYAFAWSSSRSRPGGNGRRAAGSRPEGCRGSPCGREEEPARY